MTKGKQTSGNYKELSKSELIEGCNRCVENSEDHLLAAEVLINNKLHGMSGSHVILGMEELCKAFILKMTSIDSAAIEGDLNKYFYLHHSKHEKLKRLFIYLLEKELKALSPTNRSLVIGVIVLVIYTLSLTPKRIELSGRDFNESKNFGFYVDFDFSNKIWRVPNAVVKESDVRSQLDIALSSSV
jgi:AbiV family abortive infection protein